MKNPLSFRFSEQGDGDYLTKWLNNPAVLLWFPMDGEKEIEHSVRVWMDYATKGYGFTALWDGEPCGLAVLNIQPFEKLAHTCLLSIIVSPKYRNKGVGTALLQKLIDLAKNTFHIEVIHLEVYEGNPAQRLYERLGFSYFGKHDSFSKEGPGKYRARICMQKKLN